ncbi:MAG: DUF934 domain-containing protein [Pseudohongiellaceae bacterium]
MSKLIKDGVIDNDSWTLLKESTGPEVLEAIPNRNLIVPLGFWQENQAELADYNGAIGVWLPSALDAEEVDIDWDLFPVIALDFPIFSDGRSYSNARLIRQNLNFKGELRAIGDILRDQLYYLSQCGFNAFALRHDQDPDGCVLALNDFATSYQATVSEPVPLYRRR